MSWSCHIGDETWIEMMKTQHRQLNKTHAPHTYKYWEVFYGLNQLRSLQRVFWTAGDYLIYHVKTT